VSHDNRTSTTEIMRTQKSVSKNMDRKMCRRLKKGTQKFVSHDNRPSTAEMTGTRKYVSKKKRQQKTVSKSENNGTQNFVSHDGEEK